MTDEQFRAFMIHLRIIIVILGVIAGILLAFALGGAVMKSPVSLATASY